MAAEKSEAIRPIRSLLRGLEVMSVLKSGDGLTVSEAARRARLPRTTTYRVLETLRLGGFVSRDEDERYRVAQATSTAEPAMTPAAAAAKAPRRNGHVDV